MDICIVGTGYVGLTLSALLAAKGHKVVCVDKNEEKIQQLNNGVIPFFEPGLEPLLTTYKKHLTFTSDVESSIQQYSTIFVTVGTPSADDGSTDLSAFYSFLTSLSKNITNFKTIIVKSTVPPGTNETISSFLIDQGVAPSLFSVVSNPEFLREGSAVWDMFHPDKTVIGVTKGDTHSITLLQTIYKEIEAPIIVTSLTGAELIKYASNYFLAMKISYINEMSRICDAFNVEISDISKAIGLDPRIGEKFLQSGIGYGGSCFPKDLKSLNYTASKENVATPILAAVQTINATQVDLYIKKLLSQFSTLKGVKGSILGISFKPHTDDIRYSPALEVINKLSKLDCQLSVYDPIATLPSELASVATQTSSIKEALIDSDFVFLVTDWPDFKEINWIDAHEWMRGNVLVDGRNYLDKTTLEQHGFTYLGVGRP